LPPGPGSAPRDTPVVINRLNGEINARLASWISGRIRRSGNHTRDHAGGFGKRIADDVEKWAKLIRLADIKPQ
jgi:hypothetical protein